MIHLCFHIGKLIFKNSHILERFGGLIKLLELVLVAGIYFGKSIFEILVLVPYHFIEITFFLLLVMLGFLYSHLKFCSFFI